MQAYFLSGVAGKYGLKIDNINALKEIFYGIYMEKTKNPTESIGLPGEPMPPTSHFLVWEHLHCHHLHIENYLP